MSDGSEALAVWDALRPKIEQLIDEKTRSAVRKKKMNLTSINTTNRTVTVYDGINASQSITVPYRAGSGVDKLVSGNSVLVEWIGDDISTAVAVAQGRGWTDAVGSVPGATIPMPTISNPVLSGNVDVSGAQINFFGDVLYTNSNPTQTMSTNTSLVTGVNILDRQYNLFLFEFAYSTDYPDVRTSVTVYVPWGTTPDFKVQGNVVWYTSSGVAAAWRQVNVYQTTDNTHTYWTMVAGPGYLATVSGNTNYTKYCIPLRIIGMHI